MSRSSSEVTAAPHPSTDWIDALPSQLLWAVVWALLSAFCFQQGQHYNSEH